MNKDFTEKLCRLLKEYGYNDFVESYHVLENDDDKIVLLCKIETSKNFTIDKELYSALSKVFAINKLKQQNLE